MTLTEARCTDFADPRIAPPGKMSSRLLTQPIPEGTTVANSAAVRPHLNTANISCGVEPWRVGSQGRMDGSRRRGRQRRDLLANPAQRHLISLEETEQCVIPCCREP